MPLTLAQKIKAILAETRLTQGGLAQKMGVSHQRVRNLAAGRVQKLEEAEAHALVHQLHIRGDWIATGEGPIRQTDREVTFHHQIDLLRDASETATSLSLPTDRQEFVRDILLGAALKNTTLLNATIDGFLETHTSKRSRRKPSPKE